MVVTTQPLRQGNKYQFYQSISSNSSLDAAEYQSSRDIKGYESDDSDSSLCESYRTARIELSTKDSRRENLQEDLTENSYPDLIVISTKSTQNAESQAGTFAFK